MRAELGVAAPPSADSGRSPGSVPVLDNVRPLKTKVNILMEINGTNNEQNFSQGV